MLLLVLDHLLDDLLDLLRREHLRRLRSAHRHDEREHRDQQREEHVKLGPVLRQELYEGSEWSALTNCRFDLIRLEVLLLSVLGDFGEPIQVRRCCRCRNDSLHESGEMLLLHHPHPHIVLLDDVVVVLANRLRRALDGDVVLDDPGHGGPFPMLGGKRINGSRSATVQSSFRLWAAPTIQKVCVVWLRATEGRSWHRGQRVLRGQGQIKRFCPDVIKVELDPPLRSPRWLNAVGVELRTTTLRAWSDENGG